MLRCAACGSEEICGPCWARMRERRCNACCKAESNGEMRGFRRRPPVLFEQPEPEDDPPVPDWLVELS